MTRREQLINDFSKFRGKLTTDMVSALDFALQWADAHPDIDVRTMAAWKSGYQAAIDAHPHWISVDDELPKEKGWYLVTDGKTFTSTTRWFGSCWGVGYYQPTHWMNLPAAPKKGGEV